MAYVPSRGKTLLIPSGTKNHLHIILTNGCENGTHLLVPLCTIPEKRYHDPACEFQGGEHEFIKVPTYVEYKFCKTVHGNHLVKCVDGWECHPKADVSEGVLRAVCDGLAASEHVPAWVMEYFLKWCDI